MALPPNYDSFKVYLEDVLDCLKAYHWIYSSPNTHILVNKVFEQFPVEWLPYLSSLTNEELNNLSLGQVSTRVPHTLQTFFQKINSLKFNLEIEKPIEVFEIRKNSCLTKKKQHEIVSLAPLIHEMCNKSDCDLIIDVGTGLGYLPRLLYDKYKYRILGIEGSSEKFKLAQATQQKYPDSVNYIKYLEHFVTNESEDVIREAVNNNFIRSACIAGLHACADLSVTILGLFTRLEFCKALVIMPCCYHRLKQTETGFENFPVSNLFKTTFEEKNVTRILNVPFLRLACQGFVDGFPNMTKEEHQKRTNNCFFRAILEDTALTVNCSVKRLKRKSGKIKETISHLDPFETYLTNLKHTHTLIGGEITNEEFLKKMREKWTYHKSNAYLIEVLTAFQASIQNICENVVLLDRVMFLKEKGIECFVVKVTDQRISPRCHALVAVKP